MALELQTDYTGDATALYAIIRETATAKVWNGTAYVAWNDADIAAYDVPLASKSGDLWAADMPAALPVGNYAASYYARAGAAPALTDNRIKREEKYWTGIGSTTVAPSGSLIASDVISGVRRNLIDEGETKQTADTVFFRWLSDAQRRVIALLPYDGYVSGVRVADQEVAALTDALILGVHRRRALEHFTMASYYSLSLDPAAANPAAAQMHESAALAELGFKAKK